MSEKQWIEDLKNELTDPRWLSLNKFTVNKIMEVVAKHAPPDVGWRKVENELPSGSDEVIFWDEQCVSTFIPTTGKESQHQAKERCESFGITHWMPLPNPPKEGV